MPQRFVAIDLETANADLASVCQVGVVAYEGGEVVEAWGSLINPEEYFDGMNISIHGIDEEAVKDAPKFPKVYEALAPRLRRNIVVSHTSFDRTALAQVFRKYRLAEIECKWLDSAKVARRAWSEFAWKGFGLGNVCNVLGIQFKHHDAIEDAKAAGQVLVRAMSVTGLDLDGWFKRVSQPIDPTAKPRIEVKGNREGPLAGEEVVFTGALSIPRREAAAMASTAGCDVVATVKKTTTLLVVGDQDILKLAGHEKSAKHRKAEKLVASGQQIRFLRESDFLRLVQLAD